MSIREVHAAERKKNLINNYTQAMQTEKNIAFLDPERARLNGTRLLCELILQLGGLDAVEIIDIFNQMKKY